MQGVQRYLNSAHIKTQPGVVASSKLVPFEIQQTSWSHDGLVCIIRLPVRPRRFTIKIIIFAMFMDNFAMSLKPQVMTLIKHHVNLRLDISLQTSQPVCNRQGVDTIT